MIMFIINIEKLVMMKCFVGCVLGYLVCCFLFY